MSERETLERELPEAYAAQLAGDLRSAAFWEVATASYRKIAVNWSALHFGGAVRHEDDIKLALTQDQLKAAPEYKDGNPVVVIGSTGTLEPLDYGPQ